MALDIALKFKRKIGDKGLNINVFVCFISLTYVVINIALCCTMKFMFWYPRLKVFLLLLSFTGLHLHAFLFPLFNWVWCCPLHVHLSHFYLSVQLTKFLPGIEIKSLNLVRVKCKTHILYYSRRYWYISFLLKIQ